MAALETHKIKYFEEDEENDRGCCCNFLNFTFCQFPWAACLFTCLSLAMGSFIASGLGSIQSLLNQGLGEDADVVGPIKSSFIVMLIVVLAVNGVLVLFGILTSNAVTDCACTENDCCSSFVRCFTTTVSFCLFLFCFVINVGSVSLMGCSCVFLLPAYMFGEGAKAITDAQGGISDDVVKAITKGLEVLQQLQEKYGWVKSFTPTVESINSAAIRDAIKKFSEVAQGMGDKYATICLCLIVFVIAQIAMTIVARDNYVLAREVDAKPDKKLVAEETIEVQVASSDYVQKPQTPNYV